MKLPSIMPALLKRAAAAGPLLALIAVPTAAQTLPAGFTLETVPFVFDVPTAVEFFSDGRMLVAEKGGIVYLVDGGSRHSFWVHEEEVLNTDDRGLLAVAIDPNFATNRFVYFLYTVDPDSNGIELDNYDDTFARLTRYRATAAEPMVVDESTRTVLIGATWTQGFASGSGSHTIADLAWGSDGTLIVSAGDGAHFIGVDPGGRDPGLFAPGCTDPSEDIGAFRAQFLGSLDGKLLRIDPATGLGLPSNPWYDGNPASVRSRLWAYGFRNPFRIARQPGTGSTLPSAADPGTFYVGDVGWMTWEELDVVDQAGLNFGWPCDEGPAANVPYREAAPAHHGCSALGTPENPALPTAPILALHHSNGALSTAPGVRGGVVAGGAFTQGSLYPSPYRNRYVFGDYGRDWVKVLVTDGDHQFVTLVDLVTDAGGPVDFAIHPLHHDLYYVAIYEGLVHRIRYQGPVAVTPATVDRAALSGPWPNPSTAGATFALDLPRSEPVAFAIYDLTGREVWSARSRQGHAGRQDLMWPGTTSAGVRAAPGVYFARASAGGEQWTRRLVVVP